MNKSIFDKKNILVYSKNSNISFDEFVQSVPLDFKGYVLETINIDTVGCSNAKPTWVQIYEYMNGQIQSKRFRSI